MEKILLVLGAIALLGATVYMTTGNEQVPVQTTVGVDPQVYDLYTDWKRKYNKKYATPDQDFHRLNIFNDNYNLIKAFYEGPEQSYTLDFNQFMDLTNPEFQETYLTLRVFETDSPIIVTEQVQKQDVDWTQKGSVPPVKNQASCGSCWAFSAVGALETAARIQGNQVNLSEQDLVDCSKPYGNYGCNGGLMDFAFDYVLDHGLATDAAYGKYTARDQTCKSVERSFTIQGYTDVDSGNCDQLAEALQSQPVSVAVDATNWQFYSGGVFNNCSKKLNHGVLLVGSQNGNWKVRNSWGTGWGEQGYINVLGGDTCGICQVASYPNL